MKDPVEMRSPCARAESASAGHGEEAAGSLVANGDTEEEIPRNAAVPPTTTDSVRSSTSSQARSESSQDRSPKPPSLTVMNRQERGEREAVSPASDKAHHRHSIINISADKKRSKVKCYINGDKFFKVAVVAVNN